MMTQSLKLLACQINIPAMTSIAERDAHLELSSQKVKTALQAAPVDLVVLPELSSIDYARKTFENLDTLAEPLDGPSFECWRQVAQEFNCHVAYSFARRGANAHYICLAVVNPMGELVGHYDKLHLAQYGASMEKEYFQRGDHLLTFKIRGLTFAPIICYDLRIPELTRTLVLDHGVDMILHCGAYFRDTSFATWHDFTTTRALENQVFFLSLNRAGADYGNSRLCYPWMDENRQAVTFAQHDEQLKMLDINPEEITQARETYSFLKDRLPDYKTLKN
ncbi:MAG: carbon-nitrogen hydrolase family protein [Kordiimonadaceae bacterium]|nr:carbon-nitrogen hydrolase family protein [Kordiimonadaceae bacterium]